ncbi:apolipoprotein N-acyltransferase [Glaciecola sp. MH2013]|uniref:apolipoprotein N-acyltransferase n=1 Tax=Glaciecola sp. MH2013 TaxID=2785524 RepID=UPI00189EC42B|nr:apolipoprotein N-acyltransferase [Glaciecola sp. MH2013]MBF7072543.1 apolipoprotein N-acyltransferase [Glaciecola sp. MH2013]
MNFYAKATVLFLLGASNTLAFAPFNLWWLPYISFSLWFYLHHISEGKHFKLAWCFAFGYFGAGISWVHVSIADHGGLPLVVSIGMMVALCSYLAVFFASAIWVTNKYISKRLWPLVIPFAWLLIEWCRAHFLTGFPWLSIGYSQLHGGLTGWLPIVGEVGVSAFLILITLSIGQNFRIQKNTIGVKVNGLNSIVLFVLFIASSWVLNQYHWATLNGESKLVTMVQGNIEQTMRWVPEQDLPTMNKYLALTEAHWNSDIIIWPEAAIPKLEIKAVDFLAALDLKARDSDTALITGIVDYQYANDKIYNSLLSLGNNENGQSTLPYRYGHNNRFSKHHLLPIGEFVPFQSVLRELAPIFDLPMSSFSRGDYVQRNLASNGLKMAPAICFEIAFPKQILANLFDDTDLIVTVSNDAWFGNSHGPHQHLEIAQVRAKEFGLPVLRATNNGLTAFIDHRGNIQKQATQFEASTITQKVSLVSGYTPYRRLGNIPIYAFFGLLFIVAILIQRKPANSI